MTTKTKVLNFILACTSGTIFFLAIAETLILAIGEIFAGALEGKAEIGLGTLIAFFLFLPIAFVAFFVFRASSKKYNSATNKPTWMLWVISLVLAIGVAGVWTLFDQAGPAKLPSETAQDVSTTKELEKAQTQVTTYYYKNKGMLPSETVLSSPLGPDITYRTINQSTYELCGNFDSDSVSPIWQKGSSKNGGVYQEVVEGSAIEDGDTIGIFRFHSANRQCYKLTLNLPAS